MFFNHKPTVPGSSSCRRFKITVSSEGNGINDFVLIRKQTIIYHNTQNKWRCDR